MGVGNPGCALDLSWLLRVHVNYDGVLNQTESLKEDREFDKDNLVAWQILAVTCIDLTTLAGDDTASNVERLCAKAVTPLSSEVIQGLVDKSFIEDGGNLKRITTAAVCVYPMQVATAANYLQRVEHTNNVSVASVAAGFPSGQYPLETRLQEIRYAVKSGATEIDIVIDRGLVLCHKWEELYTEIKLMKEACGSAHMKTILSAGELDNFENIYKASLVAMMAGSDFIKTSTGKEAINATLPISVVMCRAIAEYHRKTGVMVGFKPAGGIRTSKDAIGFMILVEKMLGNDWLNPEMFRIGASGLLADLEQELSRFVTGRRVDPNRFTMA